MFLINYMYSIMQQDEQTKSLFVKQEKFMEIDMIIHNYNILVHNRKLLSYVKLMGNFYKDQMGICKNMVV